VNGPEHYLEAERLLGIAREWLRLAATGDFAAAPPPASVEITVNLARTHAALALAAAQIDTAYELGEPASGDWHRAMYGDHRPPAGDQP
jgi:hypothetical protein